MADLPEGTVTFLFTDLEGSTRLLQAHPDAYRAAVARHHALLAAAVAAHGGVVFETVGDAVYAAFARPTDAVAAALAGQVALGREPWGDTPLRARMGVHLGEAERQGGHYFGAPLYRCARLMGTAHGGQVVLSEAAVALVRDALPEGAGLRDLGAHRLKDLQRPERALFARLAVFAGGFTLEAAEAVGTGDGLAAEDVLDLLTRLVDKSLVVAEAPPAGPARYRLLETLRQYAQERLAAGGVADAVRDRHAAFYLALAEREGGGDVLSASAPWLDAAELDHDNLRAALHWFGRRGTHDQALALAAGVARLWYLRGYMAAGLARLREVLAAAGAAARTPAGVRVLGAAARFARYAGDLAQARAYAEAGLALAEELDDPGQRGQSLSYLGVLAHQAGDLAGARALQEQALALLRQGREELKTAAALDRLAQVVSGLGEAAAARRLQEEALALRRARGSAVGMGWSFAHLGDLAVDGGDLAAARRAYAECFAVSTGLLPPPVLARALEGCAAVAVASRRGERGLRLLGAAAVLRETSGAVTDGRERAQRTAELARQQAGQRVADAAWSQGQAMSLEQAVAYALEDAPDAA